MMNMSRLQLQVRRFGSSDLLDLENWEPSQPEDVYFVLDLEIGEVGKDGADLFYVTVATPAGVRKHRRRAQPTKGGPLVVQEYSLRTVMAEVHKIIRECSGSTWTESVALLQHHFEYEYADM